MVEASIDPAPLHGLIDCVPLSPAQKSPLPPSLHQLAQSYLFLDAAPKCRPAAAASSLVFANMLYGTFAAHRAAAGTAALAHKNIWFMLQCHRT